MQIVENSLSQQLADMNINQKSFVLSRIDSKQDLRCHLPVDLFKSFVHVFDIVRIDWEEEDETRTEEDNDESIIKEPIKHFAYGQAWPSQTLSSGKCAISQQLQRQLGFPVLQKDLKLQVIRRSDCIIAHSVTVRCSSSDSSFIRRAFYSLGVVYNKMNVMLSEMEQEAMEYKIVQVEPSNALIVDHRTNFIVHSHDSFPSNSVVIGGMDEIIDKIISWVNVDPINAAHFQLFPIRGVLLYGPPGTGKTLLVRTIANRLNRPCITVGSEILGSFVGESEKRIAELFQSARAQNAIIFVDEIETLCPKRDQATSDLERRIVSTFLTLMDGLSSSSTLVFAATNRPDSLDPALRRPGRFDKEIEIGIPNRIQRRQILSILLDNVPHNLSDDQIDHLAGKTHGYVGADLFALIREASLRSIQSQQLVVSFDHFGDSMNEVRPSALKEISLDIPKVKWTDIGGYENVKKRLRQAVEWPLKHPEAFKRMGLNPPKGVLLYGPPGCSKTLMAKAMATESGLNFVAIYHKYVGESEKAIRNLFRKARNASPCILFLDELDALAVRRDDSNNSSDRVLIQFLNEMDGVESLHNVFVMGATNRPDLIDDAFLRPGRLDRLIYIGLPDNDARREIISIQLGKMATNFDIDIDSLVEKTQGYSGAEIIAVCQQAGMIALEEDIENGKISQIHLENAIHELPPRTNQSSLSRYSKFEQSRNTK